MKVLVDTNVISELYRTSPDLKVVLRLEQMVQDSLFISVVTFGEIIYGISRLAAGAKKRALLNWFAALEENYEGRILSIDLDTSRVWGEITASCESKGHPMQTEDAFIAATALQHGMHLMTRNTRDFTHSGVLMINPWEE